MSRVSEKRKLYSFMILPSVKDRAQRIAEECGHSLSHIVEEMLKLWNTVGEDHEKQT